MPHSPLILNKLSGRRPHIRALLLLVILLLLVSCAEDSNTTAHQALSPSVTRIQTDDELDRALKGSEEKLLVIQFYADWCGPCRSLSPIIEKLSKEEKDRASIFAVNVDENRPIAQKYNVRGIPYVVFIRNHDVVDTLLGLHPEKSYRKAIERLG